MDFKVGQHVVFVKPADEGMNSTLIGLNGPIIEVQAHIIFPIRVEIVYNGKQDILWAKEEELAPIESLTAIERVLYGID